MIFILLQIIKRLKDNPNDDRKIKEIIMLEDGT